MDTNKLKNPVIMTVIIGGLLAVVGALMGWFDVGNALVSSLADDELAQKENTVLVIALIVVTTTVIAGLKNMKMLGIIGVILAGFATLVVFNQLPTSEEAELLEVTTNIGFWLSLLGSAAMAIASIGLLVRGTE